MQLAGVVIAYLPGKEIISHIASYISFIEKLYLIDNSPSPFKDIPDEWRQKVSLIHDGYNLGIAKRLNQALQLAHNEGYSHLLTMDQDSYFENDELHLYIERIREYASNYSVGMIGLDFQRKKPKENIPIQWDQLLITSGSVVNVSTALEVGGFDEELFIDEVDHAFCLQLFLKNKHTLQIRGVSMQHVFGNRKKVLTPRLKWEERSVYPAHRLYYITRNYFYVSKKYYQPAHIQKERRHAFRSHLLNGLLYNRNLILFLKFIIKGFLDYKYYKMGKI